MTSMSTDAPAHKIGRPRAEPQLQRTDGLAPRDQILDAAAALFAEHGYAGTSTRAIAKRVGLQQASLYHHFAGKDDILLELLEISVRPSLAYVEPILAHHDPAAALHALVLIDVRTLLETPHNVGTLYLAHEVQQPRFDSFRAHRAELRAAYTSLAAALGADAEFGGAACIQLVEMVITIRRDSDPDAGIASSIAAACLRLLGCGSDDVERATVAGERLRSTLVR